MAKWPRSNRRLIIGDKNVKNNNKTSLIPIVSSYTNNILAAENSPTEITAITEAENYLHHYQFTENGVDYDFIIDTKNNTYTINGEVTAFSVTSEEIPLTRTTVDYSSARNNSVELPISDSITIVKLAIETMCYGLPTAVSHALASYATSPSGNPILKYTQYSSVENYWSSYHSMYYKKCTNRNVRVQIGAAVSGSYNGGWFDPIRAS